MALEDVEAESLVRQLWNDWQDNRERSKGWQAWALGRQELPSIPDTATAEYKQLQERAITPWLGLVIQSLSQALAVDGYRADGAEEDSLALWSVWQANRMDAKQAAVYEAAFTTGVSYVAVLPTAMPRARAVPMVGGSLPVPEWRPYSSAEMTAFYDSPHDEWPAFALTAERKPTWRQQTGEDAGWRATLFDQTHVYLLDISSGNEPMLIESRPHGMNVTPVVRFMNRQTITGRAIGEVEPYVAVASRIDQDVFDRLIVQRFASWRVRWATGLQAMPTDDDQKKKILELLVSDILVSDSPDAKFGSLPETPLDGHLRAPMEDVRVLAAVSQTPPTVLTGDLSNISAEALAAVEQAFNRKVDQRKVQFGESWEQAFDLSAQIMGLPVDESAQVRWRDMEARSLSQTADAFGKLASQLEIPVEVLWDKLGFLTEQDRRRAEEIRSRMGGVEALWQELERGQTSIPDEPEPLVA